MICFTLYVYVCVRVCVRVCARAHVGNIKSQNHSSQK